jgi:hypothetical protein
MSDTNAMSNNSESSAILKSVENCLNETLSTDEQSRFSNKVVTAILEAEASERIRNFDTTDLEGNPFASCVYLSCVNYIFTTSSHDIHLLERLVSTDASEGGWNISNRPLNMAYVAKYAKDMYDGNWESSVSSGDFEEDGTLADMQHRGEGALRALKRALKNNKDLKIPVEFKLGVSSDHKVQIDTGRKRTFNHINSLDGVCSDREVNEIAENLAKVELARERNCKKTGKVSIQWGKGVSTSSSRLAYNKYESQIKYVASVLPDSETHPKNHRSLSRKGMSCAFVELLKLYPDEAKNLLLETTKEKEKADFNNLALALYNAPVVDSGTGQKKQDYHLVRKHFFETYDKIELIEKYS